MKKILLILALLLFSSTAFAGAIKKSGFVDKEVKVNKNLQVTDPYFSIFHKEPLSLRKNNLPV